MISNLKQNNATYQNSLISKLGKTTAPDKSHGVGSHQGKFKACPVLSFYIKPSFSSLLPRQIEIDTEFRVRAQMWRCIANIFNHSFPLPVWGNFLSHSLERKTWGRSQAWRETGWTHSWKVIELQLFQSTYPHKRFHMWEIIFKMVFEERVKFYCEWQFLHLEFQIQISSLVEKVKPKG